MSPRRARQLLTCQKAAVFRMYPFVIILKTAIASPTLKPVELKIDPGSKVTGLALVQDDCVVWGANLEHRGRKIKNDLQSRSAIRRGRRNRKTRYRKERSLNRKRAQGWLPPSLMHRVLTIETWVKRICRYVPVAAISMELVRFDTQAFQNPEIKGKEYQQGTLFGYEVKEYLLEKWGRECVYCGKPDLPLEVEHIQPKSKGGTNRISNLTLACRCCNQEKGNQPIEVFLADRPQLLAEIKSQSKKPLLDAAAVNSTRNALKNTLQKTELPVNTGTGGQTKYNRLRFNLNKDHWIDAACVGTVEQLYFLTRSPLQIKATGWGNRQMAITDKQGFPKSHRERVKFHFGFQTGDIVKATLPKGKFAGVHVGRVSVRKTGVFDLKTKVGKVSPVNHKYCKAIHRNDGYSYGFTA